MRVSSRVSRGVWYSRETSSSRLKTLFGQGVRVRKEKMTVWVDNHEIKGMLVTKVGPSSAPMQGGKGDKATKLEWTGRAPRVDESKVREVIETSANDTETLVQNVMGLIHGEQVRGNMSVFCCTLSLLMPCFL